MPIFAYQHTQKTRKKRQKIEKKQQKNEKTIEKLEKLIEKIRTKDRTTDNNPTPQSWTEKSWCFILQNAAAPGVCKRENPSGLQKAEPFRGSVSRFPPAPCSKLRRQRLLTVPRSPALKRGIGVGFAPKAELMVPFFASPIKLPGANFLCRTNFFLSRIA
jgi:hypothetical protein